MLSQSSIKSIAAKEKLKEYLLLAASSHTASVNLHQWFPELSEDPLTEDLQNRTQMSIIDHNWATQLDKKQKLFPAMSAFKPLATPYVNL